MNQIELFFVTLRKTKEMKRETYQHNIIILISMALMFFIASCNHHVSPKLKSIDNIISTDYTKGEAMLDSFTQATPNMEKNNEMYCKLLRLCIADKAYRPINKQKNQVDSLVNYFEGFHDKDILAENYFMAGRVYSELGDTPEALKFFQKAESSASKDNYALKGDILYQAGTIYKICHLGKEAIKTYKKAYLFDSLSNNKRNMLYDSRDIAYIYSDNKNYKEAIKYWEKGLKIAEFIKDTKLIKDYNYLLGNDYINLGEKEKGFSYLQKALNSPNKTWSKSGLFSSVSLYFRKENKITEAEKYDRWLIDSGTVWSKRYANKELLNDKISNNNIYNKYWQNYLQLSDSINNITEIEAVKKIEKLYNYKIKETENMRLKQDNFNKNIIIIGILVFLIFTIICSLFYSTLLKQKSKNLELKIENYESLKEKEKLKSTKTKALQKKEITNSKIFNEIQQAIKDGSCKLEPYQWKELEELVEKNYPDFRKRLNSFVRFSDFEFKVCLMIKIGISPITIGAFTSHSKEGINSARGRLFKKAFNKPASAPKWDEFIRAL